MTGCTLERRLCRKAILAAVFLSVSLLLTNHDAPHPVRANPGNYPVSFYFHKQSSQTIDQITTNLWANATQAWSSSTQTENRGIRNGLPGQWDFYSQPALAGNLTIISPISTHLWISASTILSVTTLATTLYSVAPSGTKTSLGTVSTTSLTINTNPAEYVSTITSLSSGAIPPGYILNLEVILIVVSVTLRMASLSFDTASVPSRTVLTLVDHFATQSVSYYDSSLVSTASFSRNWSAPQRQILAQANVSDSLGLYDISTVTFTATNPLGVPFVNNSSMTIFTGENSSYWGLWQLSFPYSASDESGTYRGTASAFDQDGNVIQSIQFSFRIFAVWNFTISVQSTPPSPVPLQGVLVTAMSASGVVWSDSTSAQGLTSGFLEDAQQYNITAYWEGGMIGVATNVSVDAQTLLNITARVHFISLSGIFQDSGGRPLDSAPSSMSVTAPNGTRIYPNPAGSYYLQDGTFQVDNVTWKGIDVVPAGAKFDPAGLVPLRLKIYDLSLAAVQQDSSGLANARITLVSDNVLVATGTTDSSGVVFFHQLPGGDYVITLQSSQGQATKSLTLDRTQTAQIQVSTLSPSTTLDLFLFSIVLGSALAGLGGVLGLKRLGILRFNEHGFEYFHDIVGGKIPRPASLLVSGDAGSGKTLFCEQLTADWLSKGKPAIFISYQNPPDQIRKSMASFGVEAKSFQTQGKLALVDCYSSPAKIKSSEKYMMENPFDLTALGIKLSQVIRDLGEKEPLVVIDPISALFSKIPPSVVVGFLEDKAARVKGLGGDAVFALGKGAAPKEVLGAIEAGTDGIVDLSVTQGKKGLVRSLRVRKMRNQAFKEASFNFKIRPAKGIRFLTRRFG